MARRKPEATIELTVGGHSLRGERWGGRWVVLTCPSWPDLARQHEGCDDASELLDEFERRATAPRASDPAEPPMTPEPVSLLDYLAADDPPAQRHSATSRAAAEQIAPLSGELRKRVYDWIRSRGDDGATDEEGAEALGIAGNTYRPRRIECADAGLIRDSGRTRKTRSGRLAVVWCAAEANTEAA